MARILIIEDDDQFRELVRKMLEKAGYQDIEEAANGNIGMKLFRKNPFDLIITDVIMPDKDGIEVITGLAGNFPGVKIIAMSGGGNITAQSYLQMARDLGACRTLEKPFQYADLIGALQEILKNGPEEKAGRARM